MAQYTQQYEYKTVSLTDPDSGKIKPSQITEMLNRHASEGWRLVSAFSNELGKNSESKAFVRVNSTICQHFFIFERPV
ncbi:MAG: DUF4177 domain-containing protein [Oscillospiraceae bacterium]|nr:DUF4177 domain-containing protein [Oscillospiraceae bacterium]